jgi:outer membrane immunogenic protein
MNNVLRTACIATGVLAATAGVAMAQPDNGQNPFAGFYVGGMVGYDSFHLDNRSDLPGYDGENGGRLTGLGSDGIAGGVVLGYNMPLGRNFILGIEGTGRYSDASGSTSVSDDTSDSTIRHASRGSWGINGRAGVLVSPNTMIYASGGWGQTRFNTRFINTPAGADPVEIFNDGITRDAWRVGGGVEVAMGHGWTGRLDYTYSNYNNFDVVLDPTDSFTVKPVSHQVSVGVSYYF